MPVDCVHCSQHRDRGCRRGFFDHGSELELKVSNQETLQSLQKVVHPSFIMRQPRRGSLRQAAFVAKQAVKEDIIGVMLQHYTDNIGGCQLSNFCL